MAVTTVPFVPCTLYIIWSGFDFSSGQVCATFGYQVKCNFMLHRPLSGQNNHMYVLKPGTVWTTKYVVYLSQHWTGWSKTGQCNVQIYNPLAAAPPHYSSSQSAPVSDFHKRSCGRICIENHIFHHLLKFHKKDYDQRTNRAARFQISLVELDLYGIYQESGRVKMEKIILNSQVYMWWFVLAVALSHFSDLQIHPLFRKN